MSCIAESKQLERVVQFKLRFFSSAPWLSPGGHIGDLAEKPFKRLQDISLTRFTG